MGVPPAFLQSSVVVHYHDSDTASLAVVAASRRRMVDHRHDTTLNFFVDWAQDVRCGATK